MSLNRRRFLESASAAVLSAAANVSGSARSAAPSEGNGDRIHCQILEYGGTVAEIAAALVAAQAGCQTILVERGNHFGGMMASGLGATDTLRERAFGGHFSEFLRRTREYYVHTYGSGSDQYRMTYDGFFMEPHVAETILNEMIGSRQGLQTMKRIELIEVAKQGNRVAGSVYKNRDTGARVTISHEVAIDGTYEGISPPRPE